IRWVSRNARRRAPSAKALVPGNVVISGRAASCNKPSARNGGVNLQQEVVPHLTGKTSSRLANPPGPGYPGQGQTEHTTGPRRHDGFPCYSASPAAAAGELGRLAGRRAE